MPFTVQQAANMSTEECEARYCAVTADGWDEEAPIEGWDSTIPDTAHPLLDWLRALLWPGTSWPGTRYCDQAAWATTVTLAARVGISPTDEDTSDSLVRRVICSIGH